MVTEALIADALHIGLPIGAFVGAIYVERYKARIVSLIAFWDRYPKLEGTYAANWTIYSPPEESAPDKKPLQPFDDFVKINWAAGGYVVGQGTNAHYGEYKFHGALVGNAITLTYKARDKWLKNHIGVIILRMLDEKTLVGNWSQNHPEHPAPRGGSTTWKRRETEVNEPEVLKSDTQTQQGPRKRRETEVKEA